MVHTDLLNRVNDILKDIRLGLYSSLIASIGAMLALSTIISNASDPLVLKILSYTYSLTLVGSGISALRAYFIQIKLHSELGRVLQDPQTNDDAIAIRINRLGKQGPIKTRKYENAAIVLLITSVLLLLITQFWRIFLIQPDTTNYSPPEFYSSPSPARAPRR